MSRAMLGSSCPLHRPGQMHRTCTHLAAEQSLLGLRDFLLSRDLARAIGHGFGRGFGLL